MVPDGPVWWLAASLAVFALNLLFGQLRRGAERFATRRFACLAAPVFLLVTLRSVMSLSWVNVLPLLVPAVAGQAVGSRLGRPISVPSPGRWRTAVYAVLLAGLLLLLGGPLHAAAPEWQRLEVNEPAPSFSLLDQDGRKTSLADFKGKVAVATFFYSTCIDVCPILLNTLHDAEGLLASAERERVRFVAITVDPGRDTTQRLKAFMADRGLNAGNWHLLTGSILDLTGTLGDYGVVVRPGAGGDFVHNSVFVVIDAKGIDRVELHGASTPAEALVEEIRAVLQ